MLQSRASFASNLTHLFLLNLTLFAGLVWPLLVLVACLVVGKVESLNEY